MTKDEVLALGAGREMDALIATHVFKLTWWKRGGGAYIALPPEDEDIPSYWERVGPPEHPSIATMSAAIPCWSKDWNAANEVVEKMSDTGFWLELKSPFFEGAEWFAGFTPHNTTGWNGRPDFQASASTAPLAVCRAALLVVAI